MYEVMSSCSLRRLGAAAVGPRDTQRVDRAAAPALSCNWTLLKNERRRVSARHATTFRSIRTAASHSRAFCRRYRVFICRRNECPIRLVRAAAVVAVARAAATRHRRRPRPRRLCLRLPASQTQRRRSIHPAPPAGEAASSRLRTCARQGPRPGAAHGPARRPV